mmetsp:Transcript_95741/g.297578  ORF Transcript_95741/g.297578 Transcript_95741/m.297578 type:complete len:315 (-) Transcript_95741:167-1111(-)
MQPALRLAAALGLLCWCAQAAAMRVAVTGAGGQTGGHAFRKMLARPELFTPVGITRTAASRDALLADTGAAPEQVVVVDVAAEGAEAGSGSAALAGALAGCAALIIGTSAKVKPTGGTNPQTGRPNMGFPDGQPHSVDWLGQRAQIDAARAAGVGHVVICSSMGGTNPEHMLNNFGRAPDGKHGGGILLWKRKAEKYLIDSGLKYTIVHPGGLLNEPGGRRQLTVGVDDKMLPDQNRSIPREDVAEVLVQSLLHEDFANRSFDVVSQPDSSAEVATDFAGLLAPLAGASCDYGLGKIPSDAEDQEEAAALKSML